RTFERHFTLERFGAAFARAIQSATEDGRVKTPRDRAEEYREWVARYDTPSACDRIAIARQLRAMSNAPRISVLLPVFNPDLKLLRAAIESVRRQSYPHWELCIADDASTDSAVGSVLQEFAAADERIRVTYRPTNGHISAASNSALQLVTGDWCALLDQDDALVEHAFAFVALEIAAHPEARVIYSDEDKIDLNGLRSNPFFKTDWNPELFHGQNYINHLGVYETSLLRRVGGFREGLEGSQDYDVALRCCETLRPEQIRHIPRILYHWRMAPGSLAEIPDAKPYAKEAARRALADHLERRAIAGHVEACPENIESHRVIYALPARPPLVTIIILTRDRVQLLRQCLRSIGDQTDYAPYEIVILDNGSTDPETLEFLEKVSTWMGVTVVRDDGEFNFSRLNNIAARHARGAILAFLNNDIEATNRGWLAEMVSHAARPEVGAVGARLWYPDGTLQHGGVVLGLGGVAGHAHHRVPHGHPGYFNRAFLQQNCGAVTAACMLTRTSVFEKLGGFDERNLSINFNDIDYCVRARSCGLQVVWTPYANLIHHESASRGHHSTPEQQAEFRREATFMQGRHGDALLHDPFYSPNLSLRLPGFEIAFPPRVQKSAVLDAHFSHCHRAARAVAADTSALG
ncbi:MAG: glycosyltransferase family 2 protein, partial [Verrucomicrobiota bacterium]|nr:glycosyltransferase family 2 protein [Verrucomicrobiota bacterium]